MTKLDKFGGVLAVVLLVAIAYLSMTTKTVVETEVIIEEHETIVTDTLTITQVDTLWKFHTWEDDIIKNKVDNSVILTKSFLFHMAQDNVVAGNIRDALSFGSVFNFWREELGQCGVFQWNNSLYMTLYKEERVEVCDVNKNEI
jgi:hypothetical protein